MAVETACNIIAKRSIDRAPRQDVSPTVSPQGKAKAKPPKNEPPNTLIKKRIAELGSRPELMDKCMKTILDTYGARIITSADIPAKKGKKASHEDDEDPQNALLKEGDIQIEVYDIKSDKSEFKTESTPIPHTLFGKQKKGRVSAHIVPVKIQTALHKIMRKIFMECIQNCAPLHDDGDKACARAIFKNMLSRMLVTIGTGPNVNSYTDSTTLQRDIPTIGAVGLKNSNIVIASVVEFSRQVGKYLRGENTSMFNTPRATLTRKASYGPTDFPSEKKKTIAQLISICNKVLLTKEQYSAWVKCVCINLKSCRFFSAAFIVAFNPKRPYVMRHTQLTAGSVLYDIENNLKNPLKFDKINSHINSILSVLQSKFKDDNKSVMIYEDTNDVIDVSYKKSSDAENDVDVDEDDECLYEENNRSIEKSGQNMLCANVKFAEDMCETIPLEDQEVFIELPFSYTSPVEQGENTFDRGGGGGGGLGLGLGGGGVLTSSQKDQILSDVQQLLDIPITNTDKLLSDALIETYRYINLLTPHTEYRFIIKSIHKLFKHLNNIKIEVLSRLVILDDTIHYLLKIQLEDASLYKIEDFDYDDDDMNKPEENDVNQDKIIALSTYMNNLYVLSKCCDLSFGEAFNNTLINVGESMTKQQYFDNYKCYDALSVNLMDDMSFIPPSLLSTIHDIIKRLKQRSSTGDERCPPLTIDIDSISGRLRAELSHISQDIIGPPQPGKPPCVCPPVSGIKIYDDVINCPGVDMEDDEAGPHAIQGPPARQGPPAIQVPREIELPIEQIIMLQLTDFSEWLSVYGNLFLPLSNIEFRPDNTFEVDITEERGQELYTKIVDDLLRFNPEIVAPSESMRRAGAAEAMPIDNDDDGYNEELDDIGRQGKSGGGGGGSYGTQYSPFIKGHSILVDGNEYVLVGYNSSTGMWKLKDKTDQFNIKYATQEELVGIRATKISEGTPSRGDAMYGLGGRMSRLVPPGFASMPFAPGGAVSGVEHTESGIPSRVTLVGDSRIYRVLGYKEGMYYLDDGTASGKVVNEEEIIQMFGGSTHRKHIVKIGNRPKTIHRRMNTHKTRRSTNDR